MLASSKLLWSLFLIGYITAFWGSFEFACTLTEYGIIVSPIWSGTLGYPVLHHYLIGFIVSGASIALIEVKRRRERNKVDRQA